MIRIFAALPFLILAAPAMADEPRQAVLPPLASVVCQKGELGQLTCNQPVTICEEKTGSVGPFMRCNTAPTTLTAPDASHMRTICQGTSGVTTCRSWGVKASL